MFEYKKNLIFPLNITKPNPDYAALIITALGGYAGELGAALRYLNQANTMPTLEGRTLLKDIGTEELAHLELLQEMIYCLTKDANINEIKNSKDVRNYADHKKGVYPVDANGNPFTVTYYASTGDYISDLYEDLAAEQKARAMYENLMDLTDDEEILKPLSFLRQREIVHFNRFKELLNIYLQMKNKE